MSTGIVWFRRDLRLVDNPAWAEATREHDSVVAAFVVDPGLWDRCHPRRLATLAGNLRSLDGELQELGGRLWVGSGDPVSVLGELVRTRSAHAVYANRDVTSYAAHRDSAAEDSLPMRWSDGSFVHPPGTVLTTEGKTYTVFTPFHRAWLSLEWDPWPEAGTTLVDGDHGEGVPSTNDPMQTTGAEAARRRLAEFCDRVDVYPDERDRPDLDTTSRLSIDLKWGTISPREVATTVGSATPGRKAFVRQLAWRDFYAHVMAAMPHTVTSALRSDYDAVAWNDDSEGFEAWKSGKTGYPIVDAGMRQLLGEGWIHNRVRMIVASFLTKDLLIDWRLGERHFRRHLLDGDVAQNVGNWQWVAGTGADAAPYFRIFNPVTQSERFDPDGTYIRRWVPELVRVPGEWIHAPWQAPHLELAEHGVVIGDDYPSPIVDHAAARERTLAAYKAALG